jgi:hypothetical protein
METENQNTQNQPATSSQPENVQQALLPKDHVNKLPPSFVVPVISSGDTFSNVRQPKTSKKAVLFYGVIIIIVVVILFGVTMVFRKVNGVQHQTSNTQIPTNKGTENSSQNPLNNGSVDAQVKYCSNPINAATVC